MNHFCDNPECEFNIIPCRADAARIKMPGGRDMMRYGFEFGDRLVFLCERCKGAVDLVSDKSSDPRHIGNKPEDRLLKEVRGFLLSAITAACEAPDAVSGSEAFDELPSCMKESARIPARDLTGNRIAMHLIEALVSLEERIDDESRGRLPEGRIEKPPVPRKMKIRVPIEIEDLESATNRLHRKMILLALARYQGNKSQACEALRISRTTLLKKMKKLAIDDEDQSKIQETAAL